MLIEEQELRLLQGCHQERQCLSLSSGEKPYLGSQTFFQAKPQIRQKFLVYFSFLSLDTRTQRTTVAPSKCQCQILLNTHGSGSAVHGILEYTSQIFGSLVLRKLCDINTVDQNLTCIYRPYSGDRIHHG